MRCSACQLEIIENIKAHYGSEIHKINTRRQIYGAPPITVEEISAEQLDDDVSLEINGLEMEDDENAGRHKNVRAYKKNIIEVACLFCDAIESNSHYKDHGISDEEMAYIHNKVCYVCYEGFSRREDLKRHIISGKHRNVVTDGVNLILENGKIIQGKNRQRKETALQKTEKAQSSMLVYKADSKDERRTMTQKRNQLRVSIAMNNQTHYRPDWMQ